MTRVKRPNRRRESPRNDQESRTAEAVTVAWMLSLMATLAAELVGVGARIALVLLGPSDKARVLSAAFLVVALLAGLITLVLTPVTLKVRRVAPPRFVVTAAVVIGCLPLVTLMLVWMREAAL
jgi:hypothetical protein